MGRVRLGSLRSGPVTASEPPGPTPLEELLGHPRGTSVLIVTADGLGATHASTAGAFEALRSGLASSAGLMVPCPWSREAAGGHRGEDVGVHVQLTAPHARYRWGPITQSPSLLDGDGGFPRTVADLWDHADLDELRREVRAQVERAIWWGFDVTHISVADDAHLRPEVFDVVLDAAVELRLPLRLPALSDAQAGFPLRRLTTEEGVLSPDRVLRSDRVDGTRALLERHLAEPPPGVTELVVAPAQDSPELRALGPGWARHVADLDLLVHDGAMAGLLARAGVVVAGYRALRDLQRQQSPGR